MWGFVVACMPLCVYVFAYVCMCVHVYRRQRTTCKSHRTTYSQYLFLALYHMGFKDGTWLSGLVSGTLLAEMSHGPTITFF